METHKFMENVFSVSSNTLSDSSEVQNLSNFMDFDVLFLFYVLSVLTVEKVRLRPRLGAYLKLREVWLAKTVALL